MSSLFLFLHPQHTAPLLFSSFPPPPHPRLAAAFFPHPSLFLAFIYHAQAPLCRQPCTASSRVPPFVARLKDSTGTKMFGGGGSYKPNAERNFLGSLKKKRIAWPSSDIFEEGMIEEERKMTKSFRAEKNYFSRLTNEKFLKI